MNKRAKHTTEFKHKAVELAKREGHRHYKSAAKRLLKINANLISRWAKALAQAGQEAFPGRGYPRPGLWQLRVCNGK